jgi:hypothetical protein
MRRSIALLTVCSLALPAAVSAQYQDPPEWSDGDQAPPAWSWGDQDPAPDPSVDVSVGIATPGAVSFSTFHDGLSPYGQWVASGSYGQVWRPAGVPADWRPYLYGRWEWTSEGWLWVSDEPFGWATYHYGRWTQDPSWGWVWVPGYQWAPAWVTWRYGPDYVGWAPLSPGFSVYVTSYPVVYSWWTFVPCGSFAGYPIQRYAYAPAYAPRIWGATRPAPPRAAAFGHTAPAWGGPARGFVETRIGRPIPAVRVQPVSSPGAARAPGRAGVVTVFRPEARPGVAPAPRGWDRGDRRGGVEPRGRPAAPVRPESRAWAPPGRPAAPGRPSSAERGPPAGYAPQGPRQGPPARYSAPGPQAPRQAPPAPAAPPAGPRFAPPAQGGGGQPAPARPQGGHEGGRGRGEGR